MVEENTAYDRSLSHYLLSQLLTKFLPDHSLKAFLKFPLDRNLELGTTRLYQIIVSRTTWFDASHSLPLPR